jgi:hypothetical protein
MTQDQDAALVFICEGAFESGVRGCHNRAERAKQKDDGCYSFHEVAVAV